MNHQEILEKIKSKHEVLESKEDLGVLNAWVSPKKVKQVMEFLKTELKFNQLSFVSAADQIAANNIEVIYQLFSYETGDNVVIKSKLDRAIPEIDSVSAVFKTAEWHERETAEMFGVSFIGLMDKNNLLLPDGIIAPLRKDFKHADMIPLPKV
jgi:NADH-quinone oxidoreductase subunit C